ncbi:hypothetical protein [Streptomyces sp. NPDC017448]|uniref:hypothetical protein n=1 Tax=Streptomyces sp. NPDC017448 TaxID=3364996 RepID=UPI0037BC239E
MARDIIHVASCDQCRHEGLPVAQATAEHILAIDGPPKRFDFCPPHNHQLQPLIALYQAEGVDMDQRRPKQVESGKKAIEPSKTESPGKEYVLCPRDHVKGGKNIPIVYASRSSHANAQHDGVPIWDIKWGDPDGILIAPCEGHKECLKTGLAFTSERGRNRHLATAPLERIDNEAAA